MTCYELNSQIHSEDSSHRIESKPYIHTWFEWPGEVKKSPWQWSEACCRTRREGSSCADPEKHLPEGSLSCWHSIICLIK